MKYRVIKELVIRTEPDLASGEEKGKLYPGFIVDAEHELTGQSVEGNSAWLKDSNGFFYWKGAFEEAFPAKGMDISLEERKKFIPSWSKDNFDVTRFWPQSIGEGIGVAVIDSGVYPHRDLEDAIRGDLAKSVTGGSFHDTHGHGTHVAGIIAGRGLSDVYGVAPGASIIPIKLPYPQFKIEKLIKAIEMATAISEVHIINMSLGEPGGMSDAQLNQLEEALNNAITANKIVVAAAGNLPIPSIDFPARFSNVISVGSVYRHLTAPGEVYFLHKCGQYGTENKPVISNCPGTNIMSCKNAKTGLVEMSGSSMATAYLSGMIALKLGKEGLQNHNQQSITAAVKNAVFSHTKIENPDEARRSVRRPVFSPTLFFNFLTYIL